jgi:hypothetical protein
VRDHWPSFTLEYAALTKKLRSARDLLTNKEKSIKIQGVLKIIHKKDKLMNNKPIDIENGSYSFLSLL